jgi:acetyl/propionyl-CoA carboxylase alpha subunit
MTTKLVRLVDDKDAPTRSVYVEPLGGDRFRVTIEDRAIEVEGFETERGVSFRLDGRSLDLPVERRGDVHRVSTPGGRVDIELVDERVHKMRSALGVGAGGLTPELKSPMTGKVVLAKCAAGDTVEEGQTLVIIEAMKMENEIKAPGAATVKSVRVAAGELVSPGDVLVEFEIEEA